MLSNCLNVANEILLLSMLLPTFRFLNIRISPRESKVVGNLFVGIVMTTIAINWIAIISYGLEIFIQK